ncbi:MAG TPA: 23S rRNA (adenine(2503)-C(2))-methyltransferase RlmN, partial [Candidatus Eisenbacteria bacterium]|nr:23S rRNA (adenine(2503)-C(2))-methyltransferase RlmN [Candidatus Eisenbacteria bacterium]
PLPVSRSHPEAGPPSFYGFLPLELEDLLEARGHERFRARQILDWVYHKRVREPALMSNLSRSLRDELSSFLNFDLPEPAEIRVSPGNDAVKFALRLKDGSRIESVAMQSRRGVTLCVSSQAGCGMGCVFCATGLMGLVRNLRAEEIVGQVERMLDATEWQDPGFHLVFMGMGEPLANYASVLRAIRILHDPAGLSVGARRITVSTVGLVPQIQRLAHEGLPLGLAISLHASTDEKRGQIVPTTKRFSLEDILGAAREYAETTGRRVTLEYTLLAGVNDSREDALGLAAWARSLPAKINLIPYNPVPGLPWKRPDEASVSRFVEWLAPRAPAVTVRWSQGGEIGAACGQLGARPS